MQHGRQYLLRSDRTEHACNLQVRLASLSGDVFPKQPEGAQQPAKLQHLQRMLGMVMLWVQDSAAAVHQAAAGDETQLLDACRYV